MRESEKNKFLNIVSEKEKYALVQDKSESQTSQRKDDIKPIVFTNIDASTGKQAPLKDITSPTPMEIAK